MNGVVMQCVVVNTEIPPYTSPHAVATILKQFLSAMPEPLFTNELLRPLLSVASKLAVPCMIQNLQSVTDIANLEVQKRVLASILVSMPAGISKQTAHTNRLKPTIYLLKKYFKS